MRNQERQAKEQKLEMERRARERPLCIDSYNRGTYRADNLAKDRVLKDYVQVMKDAGMSEKEIENNHLSLEQKEALEEEKFVAAQKKRYGKTTTDTK